VVAGLERLIGLTEPRGRLALWRGAPGTGKTYALRALASAWRAWCTVHYVLDPFVLMGDDPRYLLDLLTWEDSDAPDRWRLAVLEDAGDLIVVDAARTGALNALLNVTDGILGQGTRTLVLVTTNEPVERLHPAVHRTGRCLADIEFGPLTQAEAAAWLQRAGSAESPAGPLTLAQLYGLAGGDEVATPVRSERAPFGFSRALRS
jgi:ATPase family associated with various cellular activities (AAA)